MREIVFDTETTGLDPSKGDRVVEIGCVELLNGIPTGQSYHVYLNPERDMPEEAFKVHGLSSEFLADKPKFADIGAEFFAFLGEAQLIAHNAEFDIRFINAEFAKLNMAPIAFSRVIDTLAIARRRHPGAPNSLDALCQRYGVDNSRRTKHGALLDAEILADVYAELMGGRQASLVLETAAAKAAMSSLLKRTRAVVLAPLVTELEILAHSAFIGTIGDKALWHKFLPKEAEEG
jgi:DNA polymerase III subunit epsilon